MIVIGFNIRFVKRLLFILLCVCGLVARSQPVLPQRAITVTPTQGIHFGTFCITGSLGGTVIVGYDGSRSKTGDILLFSKAPTAHPAVFDIRLCEGRQVNINFDATTTLYGSHSGTFTLNLGPTEKGDNGCSFATNSDCNFTTPLRIGGTLHVPGTAVPGTYTGSFAITFNQQ